MLTQTAVAGAPNVHRPINFTRKSETAESGAQLGIAMSFGRNAEIYAEGETVGHVYKVVFGVVRVFKLLPDGRRQITAFHMPGEMFGLEADEVHHASAEAVSPTKVIAYRWEGVVGTERQPANFVREILNLTVRDLRHTQDHLLLLGRKNALERLAAFLLEMSARMGGAAVLDLAMPRHDIADYLGLTLETVSRMLADLKDMGAIKLETARRVHLLNKAALAGD
jgi:CRP-like cAMP-binding protein